jgi:probable rRNA maturation factor
VQAASRSRPVPAPARFRVWARAALGASRAGGIVIRLVDSAEARRLNQQYRARDYVPNVLAFPARWELPHGGRHLGDIVLCLPVARREARAQGKTLAAHCAHLTVHGVLHLLGMDHQQAADARRMEAREVRVLHSLGVRHPYRLPPV